MSKEAMEMALEWIKSQQDVSLFNSAKTIKLLEEALAQPESEPVAWMHNFIDDVITKNRPTDITLNAGRWTPLYTISPQREWVGLTDESISEIWSIIEDQNDVMHEVRKYARAIEAKLKEKNT